MTLIVSFIGYTPPARFDDVAWESARVDEAATSQGPWTTIDTIAISPTDTDPSDPASRSFTTDQATAIDLWYRVVFLDGDGGESSPTSSVQNTSTVLQFASVADFAARLGLVLTAEEQTRADALLTRASGLIQDVAGQEIAYHATDTLTLPGTRDERIHLPQRPVVSVASVTIASHALVEGTDWYLDGDEIARVTTSEFVNVEGALEHVDAPFLLGAGSGFGLPTQELVIVYTHGYAAVPQTFKEICLEAVVRVWVNPGSVARETFGNESVVYDNARFSPTGLLLTTDEIRQIRRIVGGKARSVQIDG